MESHLDRIAKAARENSNYRIAILGRARNHLLLIAEELRQHKIPFRAVELESLDERQEVIDLTALLRALLHPMDRVAWLAVLSSVVWAHAGGSASTLRLRQPRVHLCPHARVAANSNESTQ